MQQQCVQFAPVIVGHHQVQASNDGPGHQLLDTLLDTLLVEGEQLVGAAGGTMCQFVVGRQRGLDVKIKQQHAQARIGDETAQVSGGGCLSHAAFSRNDGYKLDRQSVV